MVLFACAIMFSGCATLTKSDSQPVAFSTDPQGAIVSINNIPRGTTPVTIMMSKHYGDQMVGLQKEGYRTEQFKLQKHVAGMTFGNIIFGGIIGIAVDTASGKGMNYEESVQVKLIPLESVKVAPALTSIPAPVAPAAPAAEVAAVIPGQVTDVSKAASPADAAAHK